MNTSKVIKTEDNNKTDIKTFSLKQLLFMKSGHDALEQSKSIEKSKKDAAAFEAERLKIHAMQEAKMITENARKKAVKAEKEALEKGFLKGEQAGKIKAERELETLISSFQNIAVKFEEIKKDFYSRHQDVVLDLSLKIAEKVIHQEVMTKKDFVIGVLNSAIKLAVERERLKIRVNPEDIELCLKKRPDFMKDIDGIKQIIFESDETIGRGGAVVEYAFGEIDARIEKQFEEIEKGINGSTCQDQQ